MNNFRVIQHGENNYSVQERGWFFWRNAAYQSNLAGDVPLHFVDLQGALDWIAETRQLRDANAKDKAFKKRVAWPPDPPPPGWLCD